MAEDGDLMQETGRIPGRRSSTLREPSWLGSARPIVEDHKLGRSPSSGDTSGIRDSVRVRSVARRNGNDVRPRIKLNKPAPGADHDEKTDAGDRDDEDSNSAPPTVCRFAFWWCFPDVKPVDEPTPDPPDRSHWAIAHANAVPAPEPEDESPVIERARRCPDCMMVRPETGDPRDE
jgi:hypothetical protein